MLLMQAFRVFHVEHNGSNVPRGTYVLRCGRLSTNFD